jgi:ABC-type Fe3+/spermidine/putrescine transport system ATPase subunit
MRRMQRQLQFSGLYVTHDQMEAMELGDRIAVLEAGCIAALGPPRAVYEGPASEYVATFIGAANVWPGRLAAREGAGLRVETAAGELHAAALEDGPAAALRPGDSLTVVVRPERLQLSACPPPGRPNAIRGTVESRLFAGSHTEVVLRCASLPARVWLSDDGSAEGIVEGAEAWIWVEPHRVQILP